MALSEAFQDWAHQNPDPNKRYIFVSERREVWCEELLEWCIDFTRATKYRIQEIERAANTAIRYYVWNVEELSIEEWKPLSRSRRM